MPAGIYQRPPAEQRFWTHVAEGPVPEYAPNLGRCLLWIGGKDKDGYGAFIRVAGKRVAAHRYAVELADGQKIPEGMEADHLCRVRSCVRRLHIEIVTPRVNNLRGFGAAATNARRTHCKNGHEFTPQNTRVKQKKNGADYRSCKTCSNASSLARYHRRSAERRPVMRG